MSPLSVGFPIVTFWSNFLLCGPEHDWQVKQGASVKWSRGDTSLFKNSLSLIKLISRSTSSLFATDKKFQFSQQTGQKQSDEESSMFVFLHSLLVTGENTTYSCH